MRGIAPALLKKQSDKWHLDIANWQKDPKYTNWESELEQLNANYEKLGEGKISELEARQKILLKERGEKSKEAGDQIEKSPEVSLQLVS